ncbi:MAG TPA: PAS domain S-box protein [Deferrisomatales bacterium]|nr:PAS domain S-box protein [Deferrisomatales bacterium]
MRDPILIGLVNNAALLLALCLVYDVLGAKGGSPRKLPMRVATGALLGIIAVAVMLNPVPWAAGIIFDTRTVLLAVAGLFFGSIETLLAVALAGVYRYHLGGHGALMGVATIASSGLIGLAWRKRRPALTGEYSLPELYGLGVAVHAVMVLCMFLLPREMVYPTLARLALPVLLVYPVATMLLGALLAGRQTKQRTEAALQQERNRFQAFLDASPFIIFIKDTQGRFVLANRAFTRFFELNGGGPKGRTSQEIHGDTEYVEGYLAQDRQVVETGQTITIDTKVIDPDGGLHDHLVVKFPIRDSGGGVAFVGGIDIDVTAERAAARQLREQEERYRRLFEGMIDVAYRTDREGRIEIMSPSCQRLFGFAQEEVLGKPIREFYANPDRRDAFLQELAANGEVTDFRAQIRRKDGSLCWVSTNARVIRDGAGEFLGAEGITRDITRLQESEEERLRLEEQLRQTQKVEAIGRLAGGVAHDFNNMLGVILGYTDLLLLKNAQFDAETRGHLEQIQGAAERSAAITRQLLAFARKQVARPEVLDLNEAVDDILKMLRRLIGEDIDLNWCPHPGLWRVFIDPSQIDQILANLATNARDAISGVGQVTIETANVELDAGYCRAHTEARPGRFVLLTVSDSGRGIPSEELDAVFEPFFTTKDAGQGTGLGLATVHGIVKQNDGFVTVYSEPGHGTTFRVYLPAHAGEVPARPARAATPANPTGTETILLVEDEVAILELGATVLRGQGYTVLDAPTPADALRISEKFPGTIDLLLTDVVMPGMSGKDLAGRIADKRPGLRTLYVSGYTADVIVERGILKEGVNFVGKPFCSGELSAKVREALDA